VLWWLPTTLFASLCAVSKLPFFMTAGITCIFHGGDQPLRSWRPWLLLAGTGMVRREFLRDGPIIRTGFHARRNIPMLKLRLAHNPFIRDWFFGDWKFRMNPGVWIKGGWRLLHATLGSLPFVVLL